MSFARFPAVHRLGLQDYGIHRVAGGQHSRADAEPVHIGHRSLPARQETAYDESYAAPDTESVWNDPT